jgi:hypothetical protein
MVVAFTRLARNNYLLYPGQRVRKVSMVSETNTTPIFRPRQTPKCFNERRLLS